jgi:hypothetical protein
MSTDEVPEELATMPPGPGLAVALHGLDLGRVPNQQILDVLVAQQRQLSHDQARLLATMCEVARCAPFQPEGAVVRTQRPDQYAADEIRVALMLTRRATDREYGFAEVVVGHLPLVFAALEAGEIDRARAWVFADYLPGLTPAQIEAISRVLVPIAGGLTTGELHARLRRMVIAVDPAAAERRRRESVRDRKVIAYLGPDGTATVTASGLSPEEAAAGAQRLSRLARAVKRAGHPGTFDQIRADIFAGLYDGTLHHLTPEEMIAVLLARAAGNAAAGNAAADDAVGGAAAKADAAAAAIAEKELDEAAAGDADAGDGVDAGDGDGAEDVPGHGEAGPGPESPSPWPPAGPVCAARAGIHIRVELTTLLGRDEHPGEISGMGPVLAATACGVVAAQRRAQWRFAVTNDGGRLIFDGITRYRPRGLDRTGLPGGIVELLIPAALLTELTDHPDLHPEWTGVLGDIAAQYQQRYGYRERLLDNTPAARFPNAALRRHLEVRDRVCAWPGCRFPAVPADKDHTVDHVRGGPTTCDDLEPLCRHDHVLKHQGGWRLVQPQPGVFEWTSPLGRTYRVEPEPLITPAPEPHPAEPEPWPQDPLPDGDEEMIVHRPAASPDPQPPPHAATQEVDDDPPF